MVISVLYIASRGRHGKDKCMFLLYLQAISVSNSKGEGGGADPNNGSHGLHMEFSTKVINGVRIGLFHIALRLTAASY